MTLKNKTASDALQLSTARLAHIQAEIMALSGRVDNDWRRELIALRRQLQQQITVVAQLVGTLQADDDDMNKLRRALSRMRSNLALHQANWPAVAIDSNDPAYKASVLEIRAANRDFVALVGTLLTSAKNAS